MDRASIRRKEIDRIARSVLYEGYLLYPYRRSALKNARQLTFGTLYPRSWTAAQSGSDRSHFQTEFLFAGPAHTLVSVLGRFLAEDVETEVVIDSTIAEPGRRSFAAGELTFASTPLDGNTHKLTVILSNTSDHGTLASAHAVISVSEGELISVTDPPPEFAAAASHCVNEGVWPMLIGPHGAHDTILASPIILPDYPEVAPESAGDLCDATEIEEILTLRILTLTDEEKAEVRASGERARRILEQAETLPAEHLMKLHGVGRALGLPTVGQAPGLPTPESWSAWDNWANAAVVETIHVEGAELKPGDRVRLRPAKRADIFDMALEGRAAIITAIEQDFENKVHVAVVIEDDPGRDLGEMRQTGHRFFFSPEEIELP